MHLSTVRQVGSERRCRHLGLLHWSRGGTGLHFDDVQRPATARGDESPTQGSFDDTRQGDCRESARPSCADSAEARGSAAATRQERPASEQGTALESETSPRDGGRSQAGSSVFVGLSGREPADPIDLSSDSVDGADEDELSDDVGFTGEGDLAGHVLPTGGDGEALFQHHVEGLLATFKGGGDAVRFLQTPSALPCQ